MIDHTRKDQYGHYAYFANSHSDSTSYLSGAMTITDSANPVPNGGPLCFTLWYYLNTQYDTQLRLDVKNSSGLVTSVVKKDRASEKWNYMQLQVDSAKQNYQYLISAQGAYDGECPGEEGLENTNAVVFLGILAIDDIKVLYEACPQTDPNTFRCTFESGHNCSFVPSYDPNAYVLIWEKYSGSDLAIVDHTFRTKFGHVFALDFRKLHGGYSNHDKKFLSEYFPPVNQACVTFSYYMTAVKHQEALNFFYKMEDKGITVIEYTVKDDLGPLWFSHRVTVRSDTKWQIGFFVDLNDSDQGLIAIDDVIIQFNKACPPKGQCDFEVGLWSSTYDGWLILG